VKAGYEIVVPEHELIELCESHEMEALEPIIAASATPQTSIKVISPDNDAEWRSVLASMYTHGPAMSRVLAKHMCDELLTGMQSVCQSQMSPEHWDFPQVRLA